MQPTRAYTLPAALSMLALSLAGCQTVSDVTPIGRDTYMVGAHVRGGLTSTMEVKQLAIRRADTFCGGQGKRMALVNVESRGVQGFTPQNADVMFRCE